MHQLILASSSPRRKSILEKAGYKFQIFPVNVSEYLEKNLTPEEQIRAIAQRKSRFAVSEWVLTSDQPYLILTADTMVVLNEQPLGKPENTHDAFEMLKSLSGNKHEVVTALCFTSLTSKPNLKMIHKEVCVAETSLVQFRNLSDNEIYEYIQTGEPMDKAGSYGLQGLGQKFVSHISGASDNVVGLSLQLFEKTLKENGWEIEKVK